MTLIDSLQDPTLYPHPVLAFELVETHISWVLLTGYYAYKIKKPVDFGFLDFTSLEQRSYYCLEELRLNYRLAPDIYVDVITITGTVEKPHIDGTGATIDYAVKMRQFDQAGLLDRVVAKHQLKSTHIDTIADQIADFHDRILVADPADEFGTPAQISHWAAQNFEQIEPLLLEQHDKNHLAWLQTWTKQAEEIHVDAFQVRKAKGFIRECHGDMHLGNMILNDSQITIFDGIEFNPELRWIDVMSEIAFLMMDLHDHAQPQLAYRLLDRYLRHRGDYDGLSVLPYYLVYRALVRAKIDLLRLTQNTLTPSQIRATTREYHGYVELAIQFAATTSVRPKLYITHGLSASGKSTLAAKLVEELRLIRIRSDVERKRLFGLTATANSESNLRHGIYSQNVSQRTYLRLMELAAQALDAGFAVIVDATFLRRDQRDLMQTLAAERDVDFVILNVSRQS